MECINSLLKITYPNYKILVIDNGSDGDDANIIREHFGSEIDIFAENKNHGFAEGCNIGIRYSLQRNADYILLQNNDTIVDPDFLKHMVSLADNDETIGIVGPKIYYYDRPNIIWDTGAIIKWWCGDFYGCGNREVDNGQYDIPVHRDYITGCSILIKAKVFNAIGLLDNSYFFGLEDVDFCTRARRAGYKIMYCPKAKVWHKGGRSRTRLARFKDTLKTIYKAGGLFDIKYRVKFFKKYSRLYPLPIILYIIVSLPYRALRLTYKTKNIKYTTEWIKVWYKNLRNYYKGI